MININNVSKNFGSFQALRKVSFDIEAGEIVGFVGQNGAGKTTLMRILTSYYRASSGTVLIDGEDISQNSLAIRKKVGYLPETPPLYLDMTVKAYLNFAAEIKGVAANIRQRQVHRALEECQLGDAFDKTIGTLSKGYKQRVGIAQAIIHEPEILILDEPTSGLDPIQNLQLRNLIKGLKDQRTVILSTHVLSEIEQIAQRVLIIKAGQLIVDEPLEVLLKDHKLDKVAPTTLEDVFVHYHQQEPKAVQHG
jgi:ABC-2 type transport system ATP-binding protein